MKKIGFTSIFSLAFLLVSVPATHAQAVYAAKENFRAQVGAGYLYLNNDYTTRPAEGVTVWADADFSHFKAVRIGAEFEGNFGSINTPGDISENTYLIGPRFSYQKRKLNLYGKFLFGRGTITNDINNQSSSYNVIPAYGGGIEYRITRKINLRPIAVELQRWPSFEPNPLSPVAFVFGASYIIR